jgi:hypothetical protein
VRNHIPIRHVIETLLAIPSKTAGGIFRFRCPLCAGRNTAVNSETNLSRCFHCRRNFNAIDLCMLARHMNFVESVKFLIERQVQLPPAGESKPDCPNDIPSFKSKTAPLKRPVALHEILSGLIGKDPCQETPPGSPTAIDIAELERIAKDLSQVLKRLKAGCHQK